MLLLMTKEEKDKETGLTSSYQLVEKSCRYTRTNNTELLLKIKANKDRQERETATEKDI